MRVTTIGVGGAWAPAGTWNTLAVVHSENLQGKNLLIDCGGDVRHALSAASISPGSIGAIWITHLHDDHIDGLEYFAFERYCLGKQKPTLFIHEKMLAPLWKVLEPKIGQSQDFQKMRLSDYFDIASIQDSSTTMWQDFMLRPVTLPHINTINPEKLGNSVGVTVTNMKNADSVFFTGDTRSIPKLLGAEEVDVLDKDEIVEAYVYSDLIFQDCAVNKESIVHASLSDLMQYSESIRQRMILTHCTAPISPWVFSEYKFKEQASAGKTYEV